ncbi:MAG: cache domain-containing protein, partial [Deltaproteobacteria bacterium]
MIPEKIQQPFALPWLAARRNILGLTLGFFLLIVATSIFLSYRHYQDAKDHVLSDDQASARLVSLIVETYLNDIRSTMESYANRPLLIRAIRQKNIAEARQHLANLNLLNPSMDRLLITDPAGTLWVNLPHLPDVVGKNFAFRDWYRGVSREWKPYIGEAVLRVTAEKDTAVHIAVPVADEKGNIVGILLN